MDPVMVGTSMAIALGSVEAIKGVVNWAMKKTNGYSRNGYGGLEQVKQIQALHDICTARDLEGRYFIYTPRDEMKEQTLLLRKILQELQSQRRA